MSDKNIRKATGSDASALKELYFDHLTDHPPTERQDPDLWCKKLSAFEKDENYHILVLESGGRIVSSVTLIIIENLTRNMRPYALIENVVTHSGCRNRGFASSLLAYASGIAKQKNCYKIMLMTGSKKDATLNFYRQNGFNSQDKTGFIKWL